MDMNEFFRKEKTGDTPEALSKPEEAIPKGILCQKDYDRYYTKNNTISVTQSTDPNDPDHVNYNRETIKQSLGRRAEKIWVANDTAISGGSTIFVIVSHKNTNQFSRELPIYPQQFIVFYNVFEIRLRGTKDASYRVSEYELGAL